MRTILIKNGLVIDPANKIKQVLDILIKANKIAQLGVSLSDREALVIDASDRIVIPGLIDLHAHLCDPGYTFRENIGTGTRSAAAGGFTGLACMPNTEPAIDTAEIVKFIKEKSSDHLVEVFPVAAATLGRKGEIISPLAELVEAGAVAFSDDGKPVKTAGLRKNLSMPTS